MLFLFIFAHVRFNRQMPPLQLLFRATDVTIDGIAVLGEHFVSF